MLINRIEKTIEENRLLSEGDKVMIALSGGPDSLFLLHVLTQLRERYKLTLYAVHLNHRIRGFDAHRDALFCAELCDRTDIPFFVRSVDVPEISKMMKMTLEEAAREARYKLFFELKEELGINRIAVAHNMDDQVETVLMRIMRGTGLYGLKGMDYHLPNGIIRPLLDVEKKEILAYLKRHSLSWCVDETNEEAVYTRNKIRLELLPLMEEFSPKVKESISRMAATLREDGNYIESVANTMFQESSHPVSENTIKVDIEALLNRPPAIKKREVRYAIQSVLHSLKGIEAVHLDEVMALAENQKSYAKVNLPGGLWVYKKGNVLYFSTEELKEQELSFSYPLKKNGRVFISEIDTQITAKTLTRDKHLILPTGKYTKAFDLDKIQGDLIVRNREVGDKIRPMGLGGTKKIKNIFIDEKITVEDRDKVPIITDEKGSIIWVVGFCISDDFKIDETTRNVIQIHVKHNQ
ncbi:MAG: tRNA lysidine(34) synthetase TilS [Filifactor alocis]|nr:tRNA lysidine(34) synthetase TilS [Filifactor alocis]